MYSESRSDAHGVCSGHTSLTLLCHNDVGVNIMEAMLNMNELQKINDACGYEELWN